MDNLYILSAGEPAPAPDPHAWALWMGAHLDERRVAQAFVGEVEVSTIFLGIDMAWGWGAPTLWETALFSGPDGCTILARYTSLEQAEEGHAAIVRMLEHATP